MVVTLTAPDCVVAVISEDAVISSIAVHQVIARSPVHPIGTWPSLHRVIAPRGNLGQGHQTCELSGREDVFRDERSVDGDVFCAAAVFYAVDDHALVTQHGVVS